MEHVKSFVEGMLAVEAAEVRQRLYDGAVLKIMLPETIVDAVGGRRVRRITVDREMAASKPDVEILDLDSPIMKYLLAKAQKASFGVRTRSLQA